MDSDRVVVHFDCDAFYAQCEEIRDPRLRNRPLGMPSDDHQGRLAHHRRLIYYFTTYFRAGITQKYLIVTSNYPARQQGVAKLMSIKDAQQKCPDLVLISGEDLTPYRQVLSATLFQSPRV